MTPEKLYRITETVDYSYGYDLDGDITDVHKCGMRLTVSEFNIIRRTKCGAWINAYGTDKFVNLTCRKQFAYENIEDAMHSFKLRKSRQVKILTSQLENAKIALKLAESHVHGTQIPTYESFFKLI